MTADGISNKILSSDQNTSNMKEKYYGLNANRKINDPM